MTSARDNEHWFSGYSDDPPSPKPNPGPDGWQPGQTMRMIPCLCCPHCGHAQISRRDNGAAETLDRWVCNAQDCGKPFRLARTTTAKCHGIGL